MIGSHGTDSGTGGTRTLEGRERSILGVLEHVGDRGASFTAILEASGLAKSSLHRCLSRLVEDGLAEKSSGLFRSTPLGADLLEQPVSDEEEPAQGESESRPAVALEDQVRALGFEPGEAAGLLRVLSDACDDPRAEDAVDHLISLGAKGVDAARAVEALEKERDAAVPLIAFCRNEMRSLSKEFRVLEKDVTEFKRERCMLVAVLARLRQKMNRMILEYLQLRTRHRGAVEGALMGVLIPEQMHPEIGGGSHE